MQARFEVIATAALAVAAILAARSTGGGGAAKQEAYGFRFLYAEKVSPEDYLKKHPCVSGGWRYEKETDTHWIGVLSYPTGNVPPTYPTGREAAFQVGRIKVAKEKGLGVDLKTWRGAVILLQPDATVRFGTKASLESSFKVVAVEAEKGKGTTFLFKKYPELKFSK
jgi:hypothetical protein